MTRKTSGSTWNRFSLLSDNTRSRDSPSAVASFDQFDGSLCRFPTATRDGDISKMGKKIVQILKGTLTLDSQDSAKRVTG